MSWADMVDGVLVTCLSTFNESVPAVYTPKGGLAVSLPGIFDGLYESVDPNTGAIVTSEQPILGIRDADLGQKPRQDDQVVVRGNTYRVNEVHTDGFGGSKLFLHKVA